MCLFKNLFPPAARIITYNGSSSKLEVKNINRIVIGDWNVGSLNSLNVSREGTFLLLTLLIMDVPFFEEEERNKAQQ